MQRRRRVVTGLVIAVLAGGIVGVGVAGLVTYAQGGRWLPDQGTAVGTSVAAGLGYLVAWLLAGRPRRRIAESPEPSPETLETAETPRIVAAPETEPGPEPRADVPAPAGIAEPAIAGLLPASAITLDGEATGRDAAIDEAGALLVAGGAVDEGYIAAMHARERGVSTHMGNLLAVPHGNHAARRLVRRSALALVRYPDTIDWHGNRVKFVVAIAGVDDADQVRLVSRVAEVFLDEAAVARLEAAGTPAEVADAFAGTAH